MERSNLPYTELNLVQQQAENSRKRILFGVHNLGQRKVAFWSIDTPIGAYGLSDAGRPRNNDQRYRCLVAGGADSSDDHLP